MANVTKKDNGGQPQSQRGELVRRDRSQAMLRDPFSMIREFLIDPFRTFQLSPWGRETGMNVGFDVRETDDAFIIKADVPGLANEDVDISLMGNALTVSGKREYEEEQDEGRYHTWERSYGSFTRTFTLPETADFDKIRSDLRDGVLNVVVPKKAGAAPQKRKIQIGSGSKS
jgi:HSP20 family protein